ncbi:aminotransferase class V-fold PLP-dependent enzyme [Gordonia phthalatica]|uniref:Aminotransferase class V domain-containing protein n=1 Tax=Gordonia phthalatica TaxID=1136941 RepID=A0A0N9N598_9ACTN|nr:aminotransferase class V-fold PLP-dependent enzyme [Gordonia phthalatica]ALG86012.1 hypothetical protein ACH46_17825 [Gordonia phthalatica]
MSLLLERAPSRAPVRPAAPAMERGSAPDRLRRFVGGRSDDAVVLSRTSADLMRLFAAGAPADVVVLAGHPGLPGARIVEPAATIDGTVAALEAELVARPAALVVITASSDVTGEVLPAGRFASAAHRHGARIVVDAEHLVAHRAVSIASWGIDYVLFSSRELDALFDVHVLVGRGDWLAPVAARSEPGGVAVGAVAASAEALVSLGFEELGYREQALHQRLDRGFAAVPGVRRMQNFDDPLDRAGVYAFIVDGHSAVEVVEHLSVRHGVGVCRAQPSGVIRVSTGLGTTVDDVDRLVFAVRALTS